MFSWALTPYRLIRGGEWHEPRRCSGALVPQRPPNRTPAVSSPLYTDKGSITSPKFGFSETLLQNKHTYPVCYKNSVNQLQGSFPRTHFWIYASLPVKQLNEIFWEIFSHATSPKCCQNMSEFRIAWFTCKKHEDYQVAVLISIQFKIVYKIKFQSSGSPFSYFAYLQLLSNYFSAYNTIVRYRS